ncbi:MULTISPECIES: hypothetical protein [unclassified Archaeoglobus]|jgi:hypothetical protein|uniref:hypothetical protein n=1 Tax=unclassified Archaeoglobus TaxID=2643606 RepID=UPI0025C60153|nr:MULTISPECIES: hypothetical protein [unclassified Archaeoglobus]
MDVILKGDKALLGGILYLICGTMLVKYGEKSERVRYISAAIAVVSTLLILDLNLRL